MEIKEEEELSLKRDHTVCIKFDIEGKNETKRAELDMRDRIK